jgi:predicted HTH transcriptional regulator
MKYTNSNNLEYQQQDREKKHNAAITRREAYKAINESGLRIREKKVVLNAIQQKQPVTSRMISRITGIERTNITRSLFDLVHDSPPLIKEAYIEKCPETGKRVKWYALSNGHKCNYLTFNQ